VHQVIREAAVENLKQSHHCSLATANLLFAGLSLQYLTLLCQ